MATIAVAPDKKPQRKIEDVPEELLLAHFEMADKHATGVVEIHYFRGGVAKVYGTAKKTYK